MQNIVYFVIFYNKSNLLTIKQWIYNKGEILKNYFTIKNFIIFLIYLLFLLQTFLFKFLHYL